MERQGLFQNGVSELEVKGTVSNLDAAAGTCSIDGLTVNFSGIAAGSRPAGLANGMTVEVGGSNFANGILTADRLRDRDRGRISYPDGDGLEVEGYVADFVSIASFTVAGQAAGGGFTCRRRRRGRHHHHRPHRHLLRQCRNRGRAQQAVHRAA